MADIRFEGVHKTFGSFAAVDGVDLEVKDGEFMVLLGPSGCGKTTLLRCLAGLERVDDGRVYIGDRDATDLPPRRRRIAMVFQSYAVFPHMKVYDNIAFGLRMQKEKKPVIEERVRSAAELLHIEELLDRYSSQLSGGQRQRVAVARAMATKAEVLLMDEPLSNLDALLRMHTREELLRLHRAVPGTIVYVTHDQVEAMTMGDRIGVMERGRLAQVGTPLEVYRKPTSRFVAGFIGTPPMSFVDGRLQDRGGELRFRGAGVDLALPADLARAAAAARAERGACTLGVRPEAVEVSRSNGGPPSGWRVDVVEHLGADCIVGLRCGDAFLRGRVRPDSGLAVENAVDVTFPAGSLHLFDRHGVNLMA